MRRAARGFTLMEVLLATTLLAAALALAFGVLRAAGATVTRGELVSARNEHVRAVSGFLRSRIGGALPMVFALDPRSGRSLRFEGGPQSLRFVAELPAYLGRGGPQVHQLALREVAGGNALMVEFRPLQAGEAGPPLRAPEPLAQGLRRLELGYRTLDAQGRWTPWQSRWETPETLPLQVRVRIADAGGDWPELVVALPLANAAAGGAPP